MHVAPLGDATTTLYPSATRNGRHPIGTLTSTVDKFINDGTTTEYMTQHVGTYIDDRYAKIESTHTKEYYRVDYNDEASEPVIDESPPPPSSSIVAAAKPVLVSSAVSYEVNGRETTQHTVHHYRSMSMHV